MHPTHRTVRMVDPILYLERRVALHRVLNDSVNLLNPHPWIFWITVQGPILVGAWRRSPSSAVAFVASFYLAIVGSKVAIAWLVARGRHSLNENWYRRLLVVCGLLLIGMGALLIAQAMLRVFRLS